MASTTGLAVGLAVGIPAFVAVLVVFGLWYRSSRRFKEEFANKGPVEGLDDERDLDLDQIIHSRTNPNDTEKTMETSVDQDFTSSSNLKTHSETTNDSSDGAIVTTSKKYDVKKRSKIMGLKMIPKPSAPVNSNSSDTASIPSTNILGALTANGHSNGGGLDEKQRNFSNYYESVIPVLPPSVGTPSVPSSPSQKMTKETSYFTSSNEELTHPPELNRTNKSQLSLQQEYIRQLHKQDSSGFPVTYTLGASSPSAINLANHYTPGSPSHSASNSSMNLVSGLNYKRTGNSNDPLSARGSNQSLLLLGTPRKPVANDKSSSVPSSPTIPSSKHNNSQEGESQPDVVENMNRNLEKPQAYATADEQLQSPFDTPPRASQYLSNFEFGNDSHDDDEEEGDGGIRYQPPSKPINTTDEYDTSYDDDDDVNVEAVANTMPEDQQEYYSNYKSNKKQWLANLSGQDKI